MSEPPTLIGGPCDGKEAPPIWHEAEDGTFAVWEVDVQVRPGVIATYKRDPSDPESRFIYHATYDGDLDDELYPGDES